MTQNEFIKNLDDYYTNGLKIVAVSMLLNTKVVGGLKESKQFIDDFWYPTNKRTAGENVWFNLSKKQKANIIL